MSNLDDRTYRWISPTHAPDEVAGFFGLAHFAAVSCDRSNVKRGPWHLVVEQAGKRYPDAIVIELGPS